MWVSCGRRKTERHTRHSLLYCSNGWFFDEVGRWYWYWYGVIAAVTTSYNKLANSSYGSIASPGDGVSNVKTICLYATQQCMLCMVAVWWNIIPIDDKCLTKYCTIICCCLRTVLWKSSSLNWNYITVVATSFCFRVKYRSESKNNPKTESSLRQILSSKICVAFLDKWQMNTPNVAFEY